MTNEVLIKRLREGATDLCGPECCYDEIMTKAADEIERLIAPAQELQIPIPLRPGIVVRVYLPADLKKSEADQIARAIMGFAMWPEQKEEI